MYTNLYHNFSVGFNAWMIVAPLLVILCSLIAAATKRYSVKKDCVLNLRFHYSFKLDYFSFRNKRYEALERDFRIDFVKIAVVVSAVIFAIMLIVESGDGIIQYNDNMLHGTEDPVWSVLIVPFEVMTASAIYGFLSYYISQILGGVIVLIRHQNREKGTPAKAAR